MNNTGYDIDLVYLWVDGRDPVWLEKRKRAIESNPRYAGVNMTGRYESSDELKYSIRSVIKHLPWIRKIFIITDNQTPQWLNVNQEKIVIIDHYEILPSVALPCFNSAIIEYFIHRIPYLSEHFLYANDDMLVNANLSPSFFFADDGFPYARFQYQLFQQTETKLKEFFNIRINNYRRSIINATKLINSRFDVYFNGVSHHNFDGYLKNDLKNLIEVDFKNEFESVFTNKFRDPSDIQRIVFYLYSLAKKRAYLRYANRKESCRIRVHKSDFMQMIHRFNPSLFCLNDTERATDEHRKLIVPFLEQLFPEKTIYEK
ncbi:hypothetical protein MASR2M117_16520 [Paludibacter sp.]